MKAMKGRWAVHVVVLAMFASLAVPAQAAQGDKIVRTKSGLDGLKVISGVCQLLGCSVLGSLDTIPGQSQPSSLFLVRGLIDNTVTFLLGLLGLASIEPDLPVAVMDDPSWASSQASAAVVDELHDHTPLTYYGGSAWPGYLQQPASDIVRLRDTHCGLRETGAGIVAIIDTGVDPNHPTLKGVLTDGYDFIHGSSTVNETSDVTQASAAVVDGVNWVNADTAASIDQASAAVVDDPNHEAFGHGTMVAGVVHLAAPTARIMPLKAFGADGQGYTSDILHAIYFASQKGAKVINMSFSRPTPSAELKNALDNASKKGVILVASAGNDGANTLVYPAAYDSVIGVASTANNDTRSSFSNYGSNLVSLAAPGEAIVTTYPWNTFAAAWGTSFSTPFVSGAAALLVGMQASVSPSQATWAVGHAKLLTADMGSGRLDTYQAVKAARSLWYSVGTSPVPDACSTGVDWSAP